jgi:formate dehydrogenase major subunit
VGCGTNIFTKNGEVIDIEGNRDGPINDGTLFPKGATTFQLHHDPHRVKNVMWRAPDSDRWEIKPLAWAMDRIAMLVKQTRDEGYREKNEDGKYRRWDWVSSRTTRAVLNRPPQPGRVSRSGRR